MACITLLTDFGTSDGYVGAMKGEILRRCPSATLVDISHEIPRHDIQHAAYVLAQVAPRFPADSIHVAVVDPGVGTKRNAVVIENQHQRFVGPQNGLFDLVTKGRGRAFAITASRFLAESISETFHGRDVFAPAAAALANGTAPEELGAALPRTQGAAALEPQVVHVDAFGNLVTNIEGDSLGPRWFEVGGHRFSELSRTYADVGPGELVGYIGSAGTVEVAVREGSACERLGIGRGAVVEIERAEEP